MKVIIFTVAVIIALSGCASKKFDQNSYDRQNRAAEKSINTL